MTSASSLSSLPIELIDLIAGLCTAPDILCLRLVCHSLQWKTFDHFSRRFFTTLSTDLSRESLRTLDAIAQHNHLPLRVHHLAFTRFNHGLGIGDGFLWERHPWGPLANPLDVPGIRTLRDNLLHRFVQCRTFSIICRFPEGHPELKKTTVTDAVAIFFALVADAGLRVHAFHLVYGNKVSQTLIMDMRRLPKLLHRQPRFQTAWFRLQALRIEQYLTLDSFSFLLELIVNAPRLQALSLNLGSQDLACEFVYQLATLEKFPCIVDLALVHTYLRVEDLSRLLWRLRDSLGSLTLRHICVAGESWTTIVEMLARGFFPCLDAIALQYLWTSVPGWPRAVVKFDATSLVPGEWRGLDVIQCKERDREHVVGVSYSGPEMREALRMVEAAVNVYQ